MLGVIGSSQGVKFEGEQETFAEDEVFYCSDHTVMSLFGSLRSSGSSAVNTGLVHVRTGRFNWQMSHHAIRQDHNSFFRDDTILWCVCRIWSNSHHTDSSWCNVCVSGHFHPLVTHPVKVAFYQPLLLPQKLDNWYICTYSCLCAVSALVCIWHISTTDCLHWSRVTLSVCLVWQNQGKRSLYSTLVVRLCRSQHTGTYLRSSSLLCSCSLPCSICI